MAMAQGSEEFAMKEIEELLKQFNFTRMQQNHQEEVLQPVEEWSDTFVKRLGLKSDHDIFSVSKESVSRIFEKENQRTKLAIESFFEYVAEMKMLGYIREAESLMSQFHCSESNEGRKESLSRILVLFNETKNLIGDPKKFDNMTTGLEGNETFREVILKNCFLDDSVLAEQLTHLSAVCPTLLPVAKEFMQVLKAIGLEVHLVSKITISQLTEITSLPPSGAWKLLRGLTDCNYKCQNEGGNAESRRKTTSAPLSLRARMEHREANQEHPMDVLYASFLCCDAVAKQFLCQRLFACKLALPFLYKNEFDLLVQSDWAFRYIRIEFSDRSGLVETSLVSDEKKLPIVSFMRMGDLQVSKSKLLNHFLSSRRHETFFHRELKNGSLQRACSNGLVEAAVRLPTRDSPNRELLVLNLRGDVDCHQQQFDQLIRMSQCCVLFVCGKELQNEKCIQKIKVMKEKITGLIIVVSSHNNCSFHDEKLLEVCEREFEPLDITIVMSNENDGKTTRSEADYVEEFKLALETKVQGIQCDQLTNSRHNLTKGASLDAMQKAEEVYRKLRESKTEIFRAFPLQGEEWERICQLKKAIAIPDHSHWRLDQDLLEIERLQRKQLELYNSQCCQKFFLEYLRQAKSGSERLVFIENLQLLLNCHTRSHTQELRKQCLDIKREFEEKERQAMRKNVNQESRVTPALDPNLNIGNLQAMLLDADIKYQKSIVHAHHFFREAALLYDAHAHVQEGDMPMEIKELPSLFASLFLAGVPLELLDGNGGNIPMKWISAMLDQCRELVGDKKLFVVSVLGAQSTGKSTLLNTMFGLRLPVSAGRCTRGVFLQLVTVDKNSSLPFEYLVVIDTEGLRAVERGVNSLRHDNELATLVIGLADLTLITLNGEDSPEMRDVLQIVIHAFISMKRVQSKLSIKRKCLFVHQNVSDTAAIVRLKTEILRRQSQLDEVTRAAAEKESVDGVSRFSDVISFEPDRDTFLMPGLWHGDPPMAPMNPGFSIEVQKLKQHIIAIPGGSEFSCLNFTNFALRIEDLWKAILTQDFVFSFRNSIEMKAYRLLDEEFAQIKAEFFRLLKEYFQSTITPGVNKAESKQQLHASQQNLQRELKTHSDKLLTTSISELQRYFSCCEYKEYAVQWQQGKITSLHNECKEIIENMQEGLRKSIQIRKRVLLQNEVIKMIKDELKCRASELNKQSASSDDEVREEFEQFLRTRVDDIYKNEVEESPNIEAMLRSELLKQFSTEQHSIEAQLAKTPISFLPAHDPESIKHFSDLGKQAEQKPEKEQRFLVAKAKNFGSNVLTVVKAYWPANAVNALETKFSLLREEVKKILIEIKKNIKDEQRMVKYTDIQLLIQKTHEHLAKLFNSLNVSDGLINDLKAQMAVYACQLAYKTFNERQEKYAKKAYESLKAGLEESKELLFKIFKSQSSLELAVIETQDVLHKALMERIKSECECKLSQKYLQQLNFKSKHMLIKSLLRHGIDEDPSLLEVYLSHPKDAALKFLKLRTVKALLRDAKSVQQCSYRLTIQRDILEPAFQSLKNAVEKAKEKRSTNEWIKVFCFELSLQLNESNLRNIFPDAEFDFQALSEKLMSRLEFEIWKEIDAKIEDESKWDDLPGFKAFYSCILNCLWGCEHCCPLCNEPCIKMDAGHAENDKTPHQCVMHRPMGLKGSELLDDHELATYTCSYFATKASKLFQGTKSVFRTHKRFRCLQDCQKPHSDCSTGEPAFHRCIDYKDYFPDWDIKPVYSAPVCDLWKWIASSIRDSLIQKSARYSKIPDDWRNITKEKAKLSLDKEFGDSVDDAGIEASHKISEEAGVSSLGKSDFEMSVIIKNGSDC